MNQAKWGSYTHAEVHLRADAVDELAARIRALHERDHALHLRVVRVEVEVVDVESMKKVSACEMRYAGRR